MGASAWGCRELIESEDEWLAAGDTIMDAALTGDWPSALNVLADACGGRSGELVGVSDDGEGVFNWITRVDDTTLPDFIAVDGRDPRVNPRLRVGRRLRLLEPWHDVDCISAEEQARSPDYADFALRHDMPYGSHAKIVVEPGLTIGMGVVRTVAQGIPKPAERRVFNRLARTMRLAARSHLALEQQGVSILAGAIEALRVPAFVCDGAGRVQAMTSAAEAALARGVLTLRHRRLGAGEAGASEALRRAIEIASLGVVIGDDGPPPVVLRGEGALDLEVVDVLPLPVRDYAFGFQPRVLVVLRSGGRWEKGLPGVLTAGFGLTAVEAEIACALARGESRDTIATQRSVSVETVRFHLKSIFSKLQLRRESEAAALVARLL